MLPSEILRKSIEEQYGIDLSPYIWNEEFKEQVFSIELDKILESKASTLREIYEHGFNIGHCGLTSRYLAIRYPRANLFYGTAKLLIGTKSAPNGEHAWITLNNHLIDTTLMLCIPLQEAQQFGYIPEKNIEASSARMLSEYDLYEHDFNELERQKRGITITKKTN